jgi:hypothetical protein
LTRKAMILLVVLSTFVFFASGIGIGQAKGGPGSDCPPPNGAPVCIDGVFIPPGLAIACSNPKVAQHNKNCPEPPEEEEEVCGTAEGETPADGPVSGIVEQIAAGLRPDGAALADVLDAVACDLLAPLGL